MLHVAGQRRSGQQQNRVLYRFLIIAGAPVSQPATSPAATVVSSLWR
jgi:hypothetical protein